MTDIKQAEKRGYSRGYVAGRRRRALEISQERVRIQRQAMADRIYLALLPVAMTVEGWKIGHDLVSNGEQRTRLAALWTQHAMKNRPLV